MDDKAETKKVNSSLGIVLAKGETVVLEVSKHPIGALFYVLIGGAVTLSVFIASIIFFSLLKSSGADGSGGYAALSLTAGIILALVVAIITAINVYLYKLNRLIVTTEKVAQINYKNIIDRKVIQLSIERVQDVTVSQIGIFPRIFKYGTIIIETAGEQEDCIFTFAAEPYELAREIMDLHEKSVSTSRPII